MQMLKLSAMRVFIRKFEQNECLKNYLLDTGNKTLVEGSYDNVWGTGEPLSSKECLNPTKWSSVGISWDESL